MCQLTILLIQLADLHLITLTVGAADRDQVGTAYGSDFGQRKKSKNLRSAMRAEIFGSSGTLMNSAAPNLSHKRLGTAHAMLEGGRLHQSLIINISPKVPKV
jgi:hypothetical protein